MKPSWVGYSTFLVGLALGPPILAASDAVLASLHETNRSSTERLIRSYADVGPSEPLILWGAPDWLSDPPKDCPIAGQHDGHVLVQGDSLVQLQLLDSAWTTIYRREIGRVRAEALQKLVGPFRRTVLADCLSFPAYSGACRPFVRDLVNRADVQSRAKQQQILTKLLAGFRPLRCLVWEKAIARTGSEQHFR